MQAEIFWKNWIKNGVIYICLVFVGACLCYASALDMAKIIPIQNRFSFVLQQCDNVEVGSFETSQMGGAGNIIVLDGETYVAVGVYNSIHSAKSIANTLGESYVVRTITANDLYFTTHKQKRNANVYVGALQSLDGCMQVLSQEIERLDRGATQNSCKFIIDNLYKQFSYLAEGYIDFFPTFSKVCLQSADELSSIGKDIVYVQKLRRLLCDLSVEYCQLCAEFLP